MSRMTVASLLAGIIFGDYQTDEYIFLPAGEVGAHDPTCILETNCTQRDLPLEAAAALVQRLHLKPVRHPRLGEKSF